MMTSLPPRSSPAGGSATTDDSSDDEGGGFGASALSMALRDSDSFGGDFVVGSLPMHLRRSRPVGAASCGMMANREGIDPIRRLSSGQFVGPASLPTHLRAPFLSSREGPANKLSSMPEFQLPESAASANRESSSVPYGSLRESRYQGNLCDNMRTLKIRAAGASSNPPLSSSLGGTGIGLLSLLKRDVDDEAIARNVKFHGGNGPPGGLTRGVGYPCGVGGRFDSDDARGGNESAPLSSSLTALDILTQIRRPGTAHPARAEVESPRTNEASVDRNMAQENGSQRATFAPQQYPATGRFDCDSDDHNSNPDTFEAFDLELDG